MEITEDVYTVFTAEIEDGRAPTITVPDRELSVGELEAGGTYRIAVLPPVSAPDSTETQTESGQRRAGGRSSPPVDVGDTLEVEIEDMGEQGDGIAKIGPGYVIFVPNTDIGDRVEIDVTEARDNFAFAEVVEHEPLSD